MRPFLAFDTATDHLALALGDLDAPGAVIAAEDFVAPRAANTVLLAAVEWLLERAGLSVDELGAVACGRGPGSFTGVRIGVVTAKGLAHGLGVPLVGFGTLDAVAFRAATEGLVGVVGDAMRGEVYPALFRAAAGVTRRLEADHVVRPEEAAAAWAALGEPLTLTGAGLGKHRAVFESVLAARVRIAEERVWAPDGRALVAAAWAAEGPLTVRALGGLDAGSALEVAHPAVLLPVYTRLSDAEEAERVRRGTGQGAVPAGGVSGPSEGERT